MANRPPRNIASLMRERRTGRIGSEIPIPNSINSTNVPPVERVVDPVGEIRRNPLSEKASFQIVRKRLQALRKLYAEFYSTRYSVRRVLESDSEYVQFWLNLFKQWSDCTVYNASVDKFSDRDPQRFHTEFLNFYFMDNTVIHVDMAKLYMFYHMGSETNVFISSLQGYGNISDDLFQYIINSFKYMSKKWLPCGCVSYIITNVLMHFVHNGLHTRASILLTIFMSAYKYQLSMHGIVSNDDQELNHLSNRECSFSIDGCTLSYFDLLKRCMYKIAENSNFITTFYAYIDSAELSKEHKIFVKGLFARVMTAIRAHRKHNISILRPTLRPFKA